MDGKNAMAQYCKAQAQINKIVKESDESRRQLNERIRTYRSLLQDELMQRQLSCVEVPIEGKDPLYLRLKSTNTTMSIDADLILDFLKKIDNSVLNPFADRNGHD